MNIAVVGAGAFGTALAINQCQQHAVTLWSHRVTHAEQMAAEHENRERLPGFALPPAVSVTANLAELHGCDVVLICVPLQKLRGFMKDALPYLKGKTLVACCKGMELHSGSGPLEIIDDECCGAPSALLTGPSFAQDIAKGLPTALTLACADAAMGAELQRRLSNETVRLYRTTDVAGAALGGALKNVIAIACGTAVGAGLGESARAALMTRGYAEMLRLAVTRGARTATLAGLSGFGDLVLTCTSELSRNYRFGLSLGAGQPFDPATTVEGAATAIAVASLARAGGLDLPICTTVAALAEKRLDVKDAMRALLSRSLKEE